MSFWNPLDEDDDITYCLPAKYTREEVAKMKLSPKEAEAKLREVADDWPGRAPANNTFSTQSRQTLLIPDKTRGWNKKIAHQRRMSESVVYCSRHIGVAFPAYHIGRDYHGRIFECSTCGHQFYEEQAADTDPR
jgi:hypothetical protein